MKKELKGKKPKGNVNSSVVSSNFKEEKRIIKKKKKIYFNNAKGVCPSQAYKGTVNTGSNINTNINLNINNLNFGHVQGQGTEALQHNLRIHPRAIGGGGPIYGFDAGEIIDNAANRTRKGILQNVNISPRGKDKDGNYFTTDVDAGTNSFDVKNRKLKKNGSSGLGTDKKPYRGVGNSNEGNTGRVDDKSTFRGKDVVSLDGAEGRAARAADGAPIGDNLIRNGSTFESAGGADNRETNQLRGRISVGSNPPQRNCYRFSSGHYFANSPNKLNLAYTHKIYKSRASIYTKKYFKNNKIVNSSMTGQVKKDEFNPVHNYNISFVKKGASKSLSDIKDSGKGDHTEDSYFEFSENGMNAVEGGRDDLGSPFHVDTSKRSGVLDSASCRGQKGGYSLYRASAKSSGHEVSNCGNCGKCESCKGRNICGASNLYSRATMHGISGREKKGMGEPNLSGSNVEPVDTERVAEQDEKMLSEEKQKEKEAFAQSYLEKIIKLLSDKVKRMLTVTDKECIHLVRSIVELLQCIKKIINWSEQCHFHYSIFGIVLNIYAHVCVKIFAQNDILKVTNLKCLVCMFEILIMLRRDSFNLSYGFFLFVNYLKSNIHGIDILTKKNLKYNTKVVNNDEKIFLKMVNSFVTLISHCAESQSSMVRVESLKSFCCVLGMLKGRRRKDGTAQGGWEAWRKVEEGVEKAVDKGVKKGLGKGVSNDMGYEMGKHLGSTVMNKAKGNSLRQSEPSDEPASAVFSPFSRALIMGSLVGKKSTMYRGHTTGKMINLQKYYLSFFKSSYMCSEVYTQNGGEAGRRDFPNRESDQKWVASQPSSVNKNMGSRKENINLYRANMSSIPNHHWPKNNWHENAKDGNPHFTNDQLGSNRNVEEIEYRTKNSILLTNFETIFNSEPSNGWLTNKLDDEDEQHMLLFILRIFDLFVDLYQDKEISEIIQKNIVFFLNHIDVHIFSYVTYLITKISHIIPINKSFFNKYISVLLKNLNKERRKFIFLMLSYSRYEKNGLFVVLNLLSNLCVYNFHYKTDTHLMDFDSISDESFRRNLGEENDCGGGTGDGVAGRRSGIRGGIARRGTTTSSITDEYNTHPSLNPTNEDSFGDARDYNNVNEHEVYLVDHMIHNNEEWCSVYAVLIVLSFKYPSLMFSFFFKKFGDSFVQNCDNCLPHFNLFDWSHIFGYYISSGVLNVALEGETQVKSRMLNGMRGGGGVPDGTASPEEDYGRTPTSECSGPSEGGQRDEAILTDNKRGETNETTRIGSIIDQANQVDTHIRAVRKQSLPCKEEVALELLTHQMYAFLEYPHCVQPSIGDREWSFCYVYISSVLNLFFNKNASFFGENCFFFKKNIWHLFHDRSNLKTHHFLDYLEMFKDSNFNYVSESSELVGMLNCVINPSEEGTEFAEKREKGSKQLEKGVSIGADLMAKWRQMNNNKKMVSSGDNTKDDPDADLIHFKQPYMKCCGRISDEIEDHMTSNLFFQIMVSDSYSPNDPPFEHYEEYLRKISVELIAARLIQQEKAGFTHLCCFNKGDNLLSDLFLDDDPFVETVTTCLEVPFSRQSVAKQGDLSSSSVGKERPSSLAQHPADGSPVGKDTTIVLSNTIDEERKVLDAIIKRNVKMEKQHRKGFVDLDGRLQWSIEEGDDQGIKPANNFRASEHSCGEDKKKEKIRPYSVSSHVAKLCGSSAEGGKAMERRVSEGRHILQRRNFAEFKFLKAKIKILHEGMKNGIRRREKIINFQKKFPEFFYHKKVININHKINKNLIKIYYLFSANYFYTTNISQIIHTIMVKIYQEDFFLFKALKDCFCSFPESGKNVWNNFEVKERNFFYNFICKAKEGRHVKAVDWMEQFNHVLVGVDQLLNGEDKKNASNTYSVNVLINKILKIILKHLKSRNFINYNKCLNFPFLFLSFFDIKIKLSLEMESFPFLEKLDQGNFKNILLNLPDHVRYFFGSLVLYIEYEDIFLVNKEKCQVRETPRPPNSTQCRSRRHRNNLTTYNFIIESILAEDYSLKNLKNMNKTNKKETKNSLFAKRKKAKVEIQNVKNTSDFELEDKYLKVHNANVGKEKRKEKIKKGNGPFKKINKLNYHKIDVSEWNVKSFRCAGDSPRGYATPFRSTINVEFKKTVQINFDCSSTLPVKCKINFCYYHFQDNAFCLFPLARTKHIYVHPSQ
ncbi:hypothetical protein C922_04832 [Plasmodium inui San Antonio 1]|uniref:Uncharacterized protein n=1 Tax=Plasmodium inui San Antonio 1 TaxID=1237626 RepID=W7AHQ0_9APIC|nr:hypothetical protein C922_04832 [Plasmodium inui San Antonio 1]EUD64796.1 hypothetical protein C922_04832 [Plasmodium inui San Antonio 1]